MSRAGRGARWRSAKIRAMRRWSRFVLLWVLALALPLQAAAHEWLRPCLTSHGGHGGTTAGPVADAGHGASGHHAAVASDAVVHAGQASMHHGQAGEGRAHDVHAVAGAPADGGCAWCASVCGAGQALLPAEPGVQAGARAARDWTPAAVACIPAAAVDGLERPPRA
jgi:hypothetical protein